MKTYTKIFSRLFAQIWILILATLVFTYGVLLLTDLKNYKLIVEDKDFNFYYITNDANEIQATRIKYNCNYGFHYCRDFNSFNAVGGKIVDRYSGYKVISADYYIDVYKKENEKWVLIDSVIGKEYSNDFGGVQYLDDFKITPRVENVKYEYPAWRYYVPIAIFVFTLPVMGLTGYNSVIKAIECIKIYGKRKKESEMPVIDKYM